MSDAPIPAHQKVAYSAATFGSGMAGFVAHGAAFFYLTQFLGLDPFILGAIQLAPTIWDAITDPIMGTISDRTVSRWGRRIPYILIGGIGWQVGTALGWAVPIFYVDWAETSGAPMVWIYLFMFFMAFFDRTMHTVFHVPYLALGGEMSDAPDQRAQMAIWRSIGGQTGKIIGLFVGKWVLDEYGAKTGYPPLAYGMLAFATVGVAIPAFFCRERTFHTIKKKKPPSLKDMALLLKFRPYMIFVAGFLVSMLGFNFSSQFMIFFGRFWLLDNSAIITFQLAVFISTLASLFYWLRVIKRIGSRRIMFLMSLGFAILFTICYFVLKPYNGDPAFTGKPLNLGKKLYYKALTMNVTYTGTDIEDVGLLKKKVKEHPLLGAGFFADMDPETETDEEFVARLNQFIERPEVFDAIKDNPEFDENSFGDYAALAADSKTTGSVVAAFLGGRTLPEELNGGALGLLNAALEQPLFFDEAWQESDKLPKDVKAFHEKTLAARLRVKLAEFVPAGTESIDLAEMEFTAEQMEALFGILMRKDLIDAPTLWEWFKKGLGKTTRPETLAEKRRKSLVKELRKAFDLIQIREHIWIKGTKTTVTLGIEERDIERLRILNRRMLEVAYPEAIEQFQVLNIETAKDKLVLMLIKTRDDRLQPFESLAAEERHEVRTVNRLLLVHMFEKAHVVKEEKKSLFYLFNKKTVVKETKKDLVHDAIPSSPLLTLIVMGLVIGVLNGALTIIPGIVIPDISDADELKTGHRRMGVFFGVESFALKMATMWIPPIKGVILVILGVKGTMDLTVTPEALENIMQGMRAAWALPAGIGCFGAFLILLFYPLTRKKMDEIRAKLAVQRKAEEEAPE